MASNDVLDKLTSLKINYFEKNLSFKYTNCNELVIDIAGLDSPKQIIGKTDYDLIWKDSSHSFRETDIKVISGKLQMNNIIPSVRLKTGVHDLLVTKTNLLDDNDNIVGIVGYSLCISDYVLTKKIGSFSKEEQRLYLGETFGDKNLTRREVQIFKYILHAFTTPQIALLLNLSVQTIRSVIKDLKNKLQCKSKAEIMLLAVKNGWTYLINEEINFFK